MPEEKKTSPEEKKTVVDKEVSRRSLLKWTGALAAAGVVGIGVGYGINESGILKTPTPPPPPPPSLKPPLAPEIQTRVDGIVKALVDRHAGETVKYGGCSCNCSGMGCFFQYKFKNGALVAIEPDQTHYPNVGMEDKVMTQQDFDWGLFNRRGCPITWSMLDYYYSPSRLLYPMKRAPGTPRGGMQWQRISWDEATTTIATNMKQLKDKYGPFFLLSPYAGGGDAVFAAFGAGSMGWGLCTDDVGRITAMFSGYPSSFSFSRSPANDGQDSLKYAKLYVYLGPCHFSTHFGGGGFEMGFYRRLSREKGIPQIHFDPKYTWDSEVYSDQWIPIKAGTDNAMLLAVAYVIITEGLYNKAWIDQYMYGFQEQADYILGKGATWKVGDGKPLTDYDPRLQGDGTWTYADFDKIPKTPEWAEGICGVPANTIRELARLMGKTKPAVLWRHAGATRKSYGEYTLKTAIFIQLMLGNGPGVHGGNMGSWDGTVRTASISLGSLPRTALTVTTGTGTAVAATYASPVFYRSHIWWKAVQYAIIVRNGGPSKFYPGEKMTWKEWATIVGFNADPKFLELFDPIMIWAGHGNFIVMGENTANQITALTDPHVQFTCYMRNRLTTSGKYTDLIMPTRDNNFESGTFGAGSYGGFDASFYMGDWVTPPGECKDEDHLSCLILEKCGGAVGSADGLKMARAYWSGYNSDAKFVDDINAYKKGRYDSNAAAWLKSKGVTNPPTWEEVRDSATGHNVTQWHPSWFYPTVDTFTGQAECGTFVIDTQHPGKVDILWDEPFTMSKLRYLEHFDPIKKRKYANMANDWRDLQPISIYHPCYNGMEDWPQGKLDTYPLMILTSKSRYAIHSLMGDDTGVGAPRIRDVRRHSVWISAVDAKARGIKDHDAVRIFNEYGEALIRAYVTNRMSPGIVLLRTGYGPNYGLGWPEGKRLDINLGPESPNGGATNVFTGGDDISPPNPAKVTNLVQVEKVFSGPTFKGVEGAN